MENKEKLINLFIEAFDNLGCAADVVKVHNIYTRENYDEDEVFDNTDDFFDEHFDKPSDVVRAISYGCYNYDDNYVWFDGNGNLKSSDDVEDMPMVSAKTMGEWFIDEWNEISDIEEFKEFCERCQWGFDDEEE